MYVYEIVDAEGNVTVVTSAVELPLGAVHITLKNPDNSGGGPGTVNPPV